MNHKQFYKGLTSRLEGLVSPKEQEKIRKSKVVIIGLGGNGSPSVELIVRAGVENIVLADPDKVDNSNIGRQILYKFSDIGRYKVHAARNKVKQINPWTKVKVYKKGLTPANVSKVIKGASVILDSADNYRAKVALSRKAREFNIPVVHHSGVAYRGSVTTFFPNNISYEELFKLPSLGRKLSDVTEKEFQKHRAKVVGLICKSFYPKKLLKEVQRGAPARLVASPCIVAGAIAAQEALKIITGKKKLVIAAPKILEIDLLHNTYKIKTFKPL